MAETKQIVLGITGSIAAYKAALLARLLLQDPEEGLSVWPVLTASAQRFIGPLTFSAICGRPAVTDMWSAAEGGEIGHVEIAHRGDLFVIAPCTADTIARLAMGRANDPVGAVALATRAPILIAPAMETGMWENAATQRNLSLLEERGVAVVEPGCGPLASGREGPGRMAEPEVIAEEVRAALTSKDLAGRRVLVTGGPTREAFDPVRFISNHSSGKMGYAVARMARRRGADVCLVSGPVALAPLPGVELVRVGSTQEMLAACRARIAASDVLVMAAAPADYRPVHFSAAKIKKTGRPGGLDVGLEATPDILQSLAAHEQSCCVVGFAAETQDLLSNAQAKLEAKHLDLIVANDLTRPDSGFGVDTNAVIMIEKGGAVSELPVMSKERVATEILNRVAARLARRE